jgi:hypothetical protein
LSSADGGVGIAIMMRGGRATSCAITDCETSAVGKAAPHPINLKIFM